MLYYIHGYMSEPNSTKGVIFSKKLDAKAIKYRDCKPEELVISDCLNRINEEIKDDSKTVLIGSSLGGLLAAKTALNNPNVTHLILLNPAIIPLDFDISKIQDMPQSILAYMKDTRLYKEKISSKILIIAGTMDDVVPNGWIVEFAKAQEATVKFLHDDHSLTQNINQLPEIISNFLEEKH